jgi:hypothetical protein
MDTVNAITAYLSKRGNMIPSIQKFPPIYVAYLYAIADETRSKESSSYAPISARLSRNALAITETELKLMAAAAIIGLNRMPNIG